MRLEHASIGGFSAGGALPFLAACPTRCALPFLAACPTRCAAEAGTSSLSSCWPAECSHFAYLEPFHSEKTCVMTTLGEFRAACGGGVGCGQTLGPGSRVRAPSSGWRAKAASCGPRASSDERRRPRAAPGLRAACRGGPRAPSGVQGRSPSSERRAGAGPCDYPGSMSRAGFCRRANPTTFCRACLLSRQQSPRVCFGILEPKAKGDPKGAST